MSYYPEMLKTVPSGFKGYMLLIGTNDEAVAYQLDKEGHPTALVTGRIGQVVGGVLLESTELVRLVHLFQLGGPWVPDRRDPQAYGFDCRRWRDVVKAMNSKGVVAAKTRTRYTIVNEIFDLDVVTHSGKQYEITPNATALDAQLDEERAKNRQDDQ